MKLVSAALVALSLTACATDHPAEPQDVDWTLRTASTVTWDACIGIIVWTTPPLADVATQELPCTATGAVVMFDPDVPKTDVGVAYRYLEIPFGCEDRSCWIERTMARGSAEIDPASPRTSIVIDSVLNLPF